MDTFKTFMNIFERAVAERNSTRITEIVGNGRKYLQNIAKDDSELLLSILFDKSKGLLAFLCNELHRPVPQKGFDTAMKETFHLIEFVMEQFFDVFEPYIVEVKNTCELALATRCSALIQKAARNVFNKLIELFSECEIQIGDTVKKFVSLFQRVSIKERSMLFSVLGTILKYNPVPEIREHSHTIFQQLRNDFMKQYNPQTMSLSIDIFQVYLDSFADILKELPSETKKQRAEELYKWVKELSHPDKYKAKKVLMRSAVNLLSRHIYYFREYVYSDYEYWHKLLTNLAQDKNIQCSECGQHALKTFYRMIGNTLKHKTSEEDKTIFLYFKNLFEDQLKNNHHVNSHMLRFIVYGFSQMAAPCRRYYTNEEVKNMFSLIANCAMPLCSRDDLDKAHLERICDYQEALSEIILHTSGLSIDQINVITRLSILVVKRFPDLPIISQKLAKSSLINTIINVGIVSKNLLDEFLYNLIENGVIWTCSHTLLINAEVERDLKNLPELPKCYKNYLPLWLEVINRRRYKEHGEIVQNVIDTIVQVGIALIGKLNLNRKMKEDNNVFSDIALSQIAANEADFSMFVNIVDLYVDMIDELESSLFKNTIHKFLFRAIGMSYKHTVISGFYKLVRSTFKHICNYSEDEMEAETLEMLYKYLMNVLNLVPTFSGELLTTSLYLILNIPMIYIERLLNNTIPIYKIAFTVGLSDFELACTALNALEKWTNHLDNRHTKVFLRETVSFLEPYLQSGESSVEFLQDIFKTERKVIKQIIRRDDENTLERFQMRLLLFISSLETDITMDFIYKGSTNIGATWDKKDLLRYSLAFSDMQVDIHFDKMLPRLILLARNSGDRGTKLIACEALHSIMLFVLGKTSQSLSSNPDRFVPVYTMLYPALLHLGCDYDEAVKQIFQPFMLQLTHWLSSKFMLRSPATMNFVDCLFEGLCNESNSSLREFSGMCLAEFTKWSIKQSDDDRTQSNIHEVIHKITNFALHPSTSKRIAAATAFNHLYVILREDEVVVSTYWLELFYSFVKSLDGCSDPSIVAALSHIERVLIAKKNLLNAEHRNRRKPHEFEGKNFIDAVNWLLGQCGCLDQCCRTQCMELVGKLAEHVANCNSVEALINNYIESHGIETFNGIILNGLKSKIEGLSVHSLLPLLRSLDCYIWLIKGNLLNAQCLFGTSNSQREIIFNCAKNFLYVINRVKIEVKETNCVMLTKELEDLQTLQCKTMLTVFDFIQTLLNLDANLIPDFFFNKDLFELIAKCIMCPQVIGFGPKDLETIEALPVIMGNLVSSVTRVENTCLAYLMREELSTYVVLHKNDFIDLNNIMSSKDSCGELKQYVRGLSFLKQYNILSQLQNANELNEQLEEKVTSIFKVIAKECIGELVRVHIKPMVKEYLEILMEFLLMRYEPSMSKALIRLIENNELLGPDVKKIEHGLYFLNTFRNEIFRYMLKDVEGTMRIFIEALQRNPSLFLQVVEQLFLFAQRHKKELGDRAELLADIAIKNFPLFEGVVNNLDDRKQQLISIFGIAIHLKSRPTEVSTLSKEFHSWILNQLTEFSDMEYKIRILQNFLVCLTDTSSDPKPELLAILRGLRSNRLDVSPSDFSQGTVKASKITNCFQVMLALLPITRSVTVLESIVLFAAGIAEQLCNEKTNEYLEKYFASISTEYALESLRRAYKLFMNPNTPTNERLDALRCFLLPSFECCRTAEIHLFFEQNIREMHSVICQGFVGSSTDMKQIIASKIGCYELVGIMFAKVHIRDIDDPDSVITRNAMDDVRTGKELLQSLYGNALNVRTLKSPEPEHREAMRLLHCAAYNCSIAIVSSFKRDEDSYVSVFAENRKKGQLIWENIIDCEKRYDFRQTVKEYPKYAKRLINIRKNKLRRGQQSGHRYSYIYNYDISTCTLNEDVNAYDFNEAVLRKKPEDTADKEASMSLTFEKDDLNNHECMASICGVLKHMVSERISLPPTEECECLAIPKWLNCFLGSMRSTGYDNVRLFMLKVVQNMQTVFKPYANVASQPVMTAVYSYLKRNDLNYIIVDAIEMLMDWETSSFPRKTGQDGTMNEARPVVQQFWETIIDRATEQRTNKISTSVYKYNMNMVKTILEVWRSCLKLPANLAGKMDSAASAAVYLILICLVNGMEEEILRRNDILEFLGNSLKNWQGDEETILQCCECFGLILKHLDTDEAMANKRCSMIDQIRAVLRQMQATLENRQMKCIRVLCKNYPPAAMIYFEFVTANVFRVDGQGKSNCLEIFQFCIPNLSVEQITRELTSMKFKDLLRDRISPCESVALRTIDSLVPVLPPAAISPLVALVPPYTKHDNSEYRRNAYDVFISIHKKYAAADADPAVRELVNMSQEVLVNAILDPAEKLQEMILDFWTRDARLPNTCKDRLLRALAAYSSRVGHTLLPFTLLLILDLTKKLATYSQTLFEPLHDCTYRDYKIALSWRTKNLGSKAPLFAPSLASQMNQTFTQLGSTITQPNVSSDFSHASSFYHSNVEMELRATQEPEFEPTFANEQQSLEMYGDPVTEDGAFKVPEPAHNRRSKRFLSSATDLSATIRQKEIKRNILRAEMIKEESARQRSSVKLYRRYRIGDFPDVEISPAAFVEPLQQLAKKDQSICKDLMVSIVCSILGECKLGNFVERLASGMKDIIENERDSNSTVSAVLEILLHTRITNCSPDAVTRVSRSNSLNFLGSLVLEDSLIYGRNDIGPRKKKIRVEVESDVSSEWLQLTNLYESMNDIDVVLGIFRNHITNEDMQIASFAQASNSWARAKAAYERAYETGSELVKEHCLHGLFECLSNLCCWNEIEARIKSRLNGQLDNIWTDPWKDWMFPWLYELHVRKLITLDFDEELDADVAAMDSWLKDEEKVRHIKRFYGEESSMLFLHSQVEVAREFLLNTLDEMREQWIKLHPLSTQLRVRKLQKLRIINDVDRYIKILRRIRAESTYDSEEIAKLWNNSMPAKQDAMLPWDKLTSYRTYFIKSIASDKLGNSTEGAARSCSESLNDNGDDGAGADTLQMLVFDMRLNMIETALNQRNKFIAKKYLRELEMDEEHYSPAMKDQFVLIGAKIKYLSGDIETDPGKKLSSYASSWKHSHNLLRKDSLEKSTEVNVRGQISRIASKIVEVSEENEAFAQLLSGNATILERINPESNDIGKIRETLETYSFDHLKACCETATTNIGECYFNLSKYCYNKLSRGTDNVLLSKEFVHSILRAMNYGSLEAAHYFPCLLKPEYFDHQETKDIFVKESEGVQTWMFLSWQAQLFSHLGTSIAPLIIPIIQRIVETYPNAVIYTFRLTVETNPALLNETSTYEIRKILYSRPEIDRFLLAMQYVVQPELYLQHYLTEMMSNLCLGTATAVDTLLKKVYPNARESKDDPRPGNIFNEIARYKSKIKELENKRPEEIKLRVFQIIKSIKDSLSKRKDRYKLHDYSPWLSSFPARDVEIPGQYTGNRKPMPQYHARILKFEPTVKVMQSMRKPMRVTMIGNDAREYHFLVKFGEDLRQDQRLQQLFTIMNKTLHIDAACRQRQLSIDTYQVVPLSRTVGLIQWVNNTRSLQELIHFSLSKQESSRYDSIPEDYEKWIQRAAPAKKRYEWYKEMAMKYNGSNVIGKMNEFIGRTQWDCLRKTLTVLCPSVESFVTMRRNWISSYAAMCIAHWILGIGDRHLQNTLVVIDSGRCLGIDFGLAFDAGVDQRIPELMPFRLTPQILGLLRPFTEKDLLAAIMIHVLRALRNEQGPILSCMDVFLHEPLNWTEHVNKALRENDDHEDPTDIKWVPMKKIRAVTRKLNGIKPSLITLEQLKEQHHDQYFDRYYAIVTGEDDVKRTRAKMKNNSLTPEEQVECLLDQATDLNILGRTFVGWKPWL